MRPWWTFLFACSPSMCVCFSYRNRLLVTNTLFCIWTRPFDNHAFHYLIKEPYNLKVTLKLQLKNLYWKAHHKAMRLLCRLALSLSMWQPPTSLHLSVLMMWEHPARTQRCPMWKAPFPVYTYTDKWGHVSYVFTCQQIHVIHSRQYAAHQSVRRPEVLVQKFKSEE